MLEAADGPEGLQLVREHTWSLDVVLGDLELAGPALEATIESLSPGLPLIAIVRPECGSNRVARISYGIPSSETFEEFAAGRVVLGGVLERENAPGCLCRDCEHRWRDAPA